MRSALVIALLIAPPALAQSSFQLHGNLIARGVSVDSQRSWAAGGIGKFDVGSEAAKERRFVNVEIAQLGFDWTPVRWLTFHGDGVARREPPETEGKRSGLVQAYADVFTEKFRLRVGSFWLPTSRENVDPLWANRYTITTSAVNTWIGQEVRPVGVDLQWSPSFFVTFGATAFRGNDTMGTVLADRGWTFGDRLSTYGEDLPTPDPEKVTRPVGSDLDGENGYSARLRLQLPERAMIQFARIDNRAPLVPELEGYEPWRTKFDMVSLQIGQTASPRIVAAEWVRGSTTIGFPGGSATVDFDTAYILVSQKSGRDRYSTRIERFSTRDEDGRAATIAWMRDMSNKLRLGAEYSRVEGERDDAPVDGSTITLELRYSF